MAGKESLKAWKDSGTYTSGIPRYINLPSVGVDRQLYMLDPVHPLHSSLSSGILPARDTAVELCFKLSNWLKKTSHPQRRPSASRQATADPPCLFQDLQPYEKKRKNVSLVIS